MKAFKTIIPFIKKNQQYYWIGIIFLIAVDAVSLLLPQVLREFVNLAMTGNLNRQGLVRICLSLIGMGLFTAFGRVIWRNMIFGISPKIQAWLRERIFEKYLQLDDEFYAEHMTGDLMAHATNDVLTVGMTMGGGVMVLVDSIFMSAFCIAMMFYTSGLLDTMVALSALPIIGIFISIISGPLADNNRSVQDAFSDLTAEVQENLSGIRVIKGDAAEETTMDSFEKANKDYLRKFLSLMKLEVLIDPAINFIASLSIVFIMLYASFRIMGGQMGVGDFVALSQYMFMMIWPMIALGMINSRLQRGIASMERINEILRTEPKIKERENPISLDDIEGNIEFDNVSFRYSKEGPWILKNVSFKFKAGLSLAILGKTGSGKTTILSLLLRRYDPNEGRILLDGVDIRDLDFKSLYKAFSLVAQTSFLFSTTIAENISMDSENEDRKRVIEAAKFAQVDGDIRGLEDSYESLVGERGVALSGGQKQRVSIARAYYRDAPIMLLDDSLSAVDTETEEKILQHIRQHKKGIILISQRVSTVQDADMILVIEGGDIIQRGRHAELVKEDGFYRDLYERQLLESRAEEKNDPDQEPVSIEKEEEI